MALTDLEKQKIRFMFEDYKQGDLADYMQQISVSDDFALSELAAYIENEAVILNRNIPNLQLSIADSTTELQKITNKLSILQQ